MQRVRPACPRRTPEAYPDASMAQGQVPHTSLRLRRADVVRMLFKKGLQLDGPRARLAQVARHRQD